MRTLRALINRAIKEEICKPVYYPFKKYKISDLNHTTQKRAISKKEIDLIFQHEPEPNTTQLHSKFLFMFSFYAMGMNFKDMSLLKWTDIRNDRISYKRSKTGKNFSIKLLPPMLEILEHQRKHNKGNPYLSLIHI